MVTCQIYYIKKKTVQKYNTKNKYYIELADFGMLIAIQVCSTIKRPYQNYEPYAALKLRKLISKFR